jgi:uncharacterized protein (TIGR03435 family)
MFRSGLLIFVGAFAFGQATQRPTFEVASVKPSAPVPPNGGVYFGPPRGGPGTPAPGQITWTYATLRGLLMTAYDVKEYQVSGPAWLNTERYDIIAKVAEGATKEQVNVMWQNLLADRFGVMLHRESKEFQVEELVIAKAGHKLKETTVDPAAELDPGPPKFDKNRELAGPGFVTTFMASGQAHTVAKAQPLSKLTAMLGGVLRRPVLDKTGLTGKYDFSIEFRIDLRGLGLPPAGPGGPATGTGPVDSATEPGPDLAAAVQQQLGLRLVGGRRTLRCWSSTRLKECPRTTDHTLMEPGCPAKLATGKGPDNRQSAKELVDGDFCQNNKVPVDHEPSIFLSTSAERLVGSRSLGSWMGSIVDRRSHRTTHLGI